MPSPRVALIALDACQADILLSLADAGRAPTVAALRSSAAWGPTHTPDGLFVGAVFPTLVTGCSPAAHGRYCFRQFHPGTYEVYPTDVSVSIQRPAFWEQLSAAGRRCAVLDVPHTAVDPDINGLHLVDWAAHDANPGFRTSDPAFTEFMGTFGDHPIGVDCNGHRRSAEDFEVLVDGLLAGAGMRVALSEHVLDMERWDLFMTAFSETHCVGHQAWCVHDETHPRHDASVAASVGDVVLRVYERVDAELGRLLERFDDDTTVVVVCSHGMGPHYGGNHLLDELLERLDLGPGRSLRATYIGAKRWAQARAPRRLRQLRRRLRGGQVTAQGTKRPPGNAPALIADAALRRYFGVPNNDVYGAVRLNIIGREPAGRVRPEDADDVIDALKRSLLAVRNVDTGRAAVRQVLRTSELYDGPLLGALPDLLIEWDWSAPISRVTSPAIGLLEVEDVDDRTGDHRPGGLVFVRGPGIRPQLLARRIPTQDIAPTVAALLGVTLTGVDGVPIPEIAPAFTTTA